MLHMAPNLKPKSYLSVLFFLVFILFSDNSNAEFEDEVPQKFRTAPHKNVGSNVIDGMGPENSFEDTDNMVGNRKSGRNKVSVSTVALFTLAMVAASGLGAIPFFSVELDPQWAGLCNGMAAGVMLAASFDLIQEGQDHGAGNWVVTGILASGIFIWLCKKHALLMGTACGMVLVLVAWRPVQIIPSSKLGFIPFVLLLAMGAAFIPVSSLVVLKVTAGCKKALVNDLPTFTGFPLSVHTLLPFISCGAVAFHALGEALALGVAAPETYGLVRHMVLPISLHGLPWGAAVARFIFGATDSWHGSLAMAAIIGFVSPMSAIGAVLAGIDYSGLDHVMVFASAGLIPSFGHMVKRALRLDKRNSTCGLIMGIGFNTLCLTSTRFVCVHTPYCNYCT